MHRPAAIFDTRHHARNEKRLAVLNQAAELFLTQGYHRTRMDDIATRLGLTKPALYNYFKSKHEILYACHMLGHDLIDAELGVIEKVGGAGLDRLRALIRAYAGIMTQRFGMCLILLDEHELPAKQLARVVDRRRLINACFERYLELGVSDGSIQDGDARLRAFAIAGALNWIARWYKPGGQMTSIALGHYMAEELTRGLAPVLG